MYFDIEHCGALRFTTHYLDEYLYVICFNFGPGRITDQQLLQILVSGPKLKAVVIQKLFYNFPSLIYCPRFLTCNKLVFYCSIISSVFYYNLSSKVVLEYCYTFFECCKNVDCAVILSGIGLVIFGG